MQSSQVRFMVDGERIAPEDTADKLGLEDNDLIDVAMEQTGGGVDDSAAAKAEDAAADAPQHIQLKVKDQHGGEVQFKIKRSTALRKLMDAYCSRLGMQSSQGWMIVRPRRMLWLGNCSDFGKC